MLQIIVAVLQILTAIGTALFWILFFTGDSKSQLPEYRYKHEKSFAAGDIMCVVTPLGIAATGLLLGQPFGYLFTAISGGTMVFLGFLDGAFNLQNDLFNRKKLGSDAIMNIFIVAHMLIFGSFSLYYGSIHVLN